tara:strand:+ start:9780 stop:10181 length:402 start_codon:yes stop_codon:yes gene_type:complete
MKNIEIIYDNDVAVAYFIDSNWNPKKTEFITPDDLNQQMGMIVYSKDESITPHEHLPITRTIEGTTECIIVRKGSCFIDIYNKEQKKINTKKLKIGDIILLLGGSHGFRMIEDTVLFEVKQGPYAGDQDKRRF